MAISAANSTVVPPAATSATVTDDALTIELSDGRSVSAPLAWYPRLLHATAEERRNWRLIAEGEGIHWPDVDEDISVASLIAGRPSAERRRRCRAGWRGAKPR